MIYVAFDQRYSTVFIDFVGRIELNQEAKFFEDVKKVIPAGRCFCVVTDVTQVESWAPGVQHAIKRAMDFLNAQGVRTIIRIIPSHHKDIGFNIMSIFHYDPSVKLITVQSREEAIARLEGMAQTRQ